MRTPYFSIFRGVLFLMLLATAGVVAAAGSLSGSVTEHDTNAALQDVTVQLYQSADPNWAGENAWNYVAGTSTDANGDYQFINLEARQYHVHVMTGSMDSSGRHFAQADLYHVQVFDNAETPGMDLQLREAGYIWGYVLTEGGTPIPNASVIGHGEWVDDGRDWHPVGSDQNGLYRLWLLSSPGKFYAVSTERAQIGATQYEAQYAPELYQATLAGVRGPDFTLAEGGCIQGRIVNDQGAGIPGVEVDPRIGILDDPDDRTDSQGYYTLGYLPATDQAYVYIDQWNLRPAVLNGVKYGSGRRFVGPLTVTPGQSCTQAPDMVMPESGGIEGVVTDAAGTPIVGAEIEFDGFETDGYELGDDQIFTDAFGQYTLDFLPPGEYTVRAVKEGWITPSQSDVIVTSGELTDVDLVMQTSGQGTVVSGKVIDFLANTCHKDSAGILLPAYVESEHLQGCDTGIVALRGGADNRDQALLDLDSQIVDFTTIDDGYTDYFAAAPTEVIGDYQMALPPGIIDAAPYSSYETDRGWYAVFHGKHRWVLSVGEMLTDQDFSLPPLMNSGALQGVITYPAGARFNPQRTRIIAINENNPSDFLLGDAIASPEFKSAYGFDKLPAGSYTLRAISDGFVTQIYPGITVLSGATTVQDINLASGATLSGVVSDATTGLPLAGARVEITANGKAGISDGAGAYTISGLAADDYQLLASKPGYATFSGAVSVVEPATSYDIALDSMAGSIAGRVEDATGAAINNAQVVAYNPALNSHKIGSTIGGDFSIGDLPAGDYVLGINAPGYSTVQHPPAGVLILNPAQALTIADPIVIQQTPPLFDSASTVDETAGVKTLSVTITSDRDLLSAPVIDSRGLDTAAGCSSFNWQQVTASKYLASCTVEANETLVWIGITEGIVPVLPGNPASATFSVEVASNLLDTSTTNFFNAIGGDSTIMGTQDNTKAYIPPFALTGADSQAVKLTVTRYGNPGDTVAGNNNQTASAVYDFSFEDGGVQIDVNHRAAITLQFHKPADMTQEAFEADLKIGFFRVSDQQWVYHTDPDSGISNIHINWLNNTATFDVNHFTPFAAFLPAAQTIPGDLDGDEDIDRNDLDILLADRNKSVAESSCGSACDLDGDGRVTALDARKMVLLCTRPRCATE